MMVQIERDGETLRVALPADMTNASHLEAGSYVDVTLVDGRIMLVPVKPEDMTLEELLAQVTPENRHGEIDTGPPVGNEIW